MAHRATLTTVAATSLAATAVSSAALAGWAVFGERRRFRVRHETLRVLAPGSPDLRVLQISDLHTVPGQEAKKKFVHGLAQLEPDLVLDTGDNLSHLDALPYLLEILKPLFDFPGLYVPGSNCYFAPMFKNPARYLWQRTSAEDDRTEAQILPWEAMHRAFDHAGWVGVINRADRLKFGEHVIEVSGVDDPHLGYDQHPGFLPSTHPGSGLGRFESAAGVGTSLRLGLTHAPYLRTLNRFAQDGADLVVAGHTHGGQVCLPGGRALVSNCDIEPERCKGVTSQGGVPVQISAGLGESRFAPVRLFCPPEAVLMTLTARDN